MNGVVPRRSSTGISTTVSCSSRATASAVSCSRVSRSASDIWCIRRSPSMTSRRLRAVIRSVSSSLHPVLGGDQLLGLTGEALLGHLEQLVDLRPALVVRELELAPRLEVLEAAVELRVLRGGVLELPHQLLRPRLLGRAITIGLHRDVLGLGVAEPFGLELAAQLLDRSVRARQILLQRGQRAPHLVGFLARLTDRGRALLHLGGVTLELSADPSDLVVRFEELLLSAGCLGASGGDLVPHHLQVVARGVRRRLCVGDPATQFRLALFQLAPVGGLDLLELALELLTRCPDLLLELGLALDEVGTMGGSAAFELSLRGAELVLQHGRALLLVAERAELRVRVPQFALRARELRLGRRESVSDLQHLDVRRVDLFLAAGGGFGRPHRGELSAGRVELLLRHGELGVQADRFQLGFAEPQILLVVVDDAHRLLDRFLELRGQALALLRDGPQLELELLDLTLRAQRALLDPCRPRAPTWSRWRAAGTTGALPASCGTDPATARAAPQPREPVPRPAVSPRLPL